VVEHWDLIVIGGGPAGSTAAISARTRGCRMLVLEAAQFPRHHVGESLVTLWPYFDRLGVAEEMDATFQHKHGSARIWGRDAGVKWTDFKTQASAKPYSLQVERARFDAILLRRARTVGSVVREGHRVTGLIWERERAVGVRFLTPAGSAEEARAAFVVDASGRSGMVARRLGLRRIDAFFPDLSVYGYVRGAQRFAGELAGNLFIEAVPWGSFWFIPLRSDAVSVGLVCDQSSRQVLRERGVNGFFAEAVASSNELKRLLGAGSLAWGPAVTASYGYASARYAGPGWLLAGDAGAFIDPMWATGVANAVTDGLLAGGVVEAALSGRVREEDALAFYERELSERTAGQLPLVKFVYRCNRLFAEQPFWRRRHEAAGGDTVSSERVLRRLARDPSARYFRDAFRGMGLDEHELAPLEAALDRAEHRRNVAWLLQDLDGWRPTLPTRVRLRRGLGVVEERVVEGLEVEDDGVRWFTGDLFTAAAFEAIDGRTTAGALVTTFAATAPAGERLATHFRLIAGLIGAYREGLLDICTR
jgi:FAD-dependent halogenase